LTQVPGCGAQTATLNDGHEVFELIELHCWVRPDTWALIWTIIIWI